MKRQDGKPRLFSFTLRDFLIFAAIFICALMLCTLLRRSDISDGFASPVFVLAVLLTSRFTNGYLFGTLAAFLSVIGINYIFTFPYWEFNFTMTGYPLTFFVMLCVSLITCTMTSRIKQQESIRMEIEKEKMRANLLRSVSHDIRTPLSMVMGYAGQLEENPALPEQARKQAAIIRRQSQTIRDLVNDLNLTMRLDCEMQALRKAPLELAPFLRQTAADFLNSGLEHEVDLDLRLPKAPLPRIEVDAFLLRRALNNLLLNAARHAPPGSVICLGVTNSVGAADSCGPPSPTCVLWVENQTGQAQAQPSDQDGGAPHGTGRKLVSQIAQAHGGRAVFSDGARFRGEIWLPVGDKKQALRVWRA